MNLHAVTLLSQKLAPEKLHGLFFAGLAISAIIWVLFALKRGDRLFPTIGLAAAVITLFYLTSPYATDAARWWIAGGITFVGLVFLWLSRHQVWKPLLIATGLLIVLVGVFLTSSSVNLLSFEKSLGNSLAFYFLSCLAWLVIQVVIPRTRGKQQAVQAAGLTVVISIVMFTVATTWWREAVDEQELPGSPVAKTGAEIERLFSLPRGSRRLGIFAVGLLGDPAPRNGGAGEATENLAYFTGRTPGAGIKRGSTSYLPAQYELRMADGAVIRVAGISSTSQAYNWPDRDPLLWQHSLRQGDPVVIWADPGETITAADGKRIPSLTATRVIAYGSLESFRGDFLNDLVKTTRVIGWIAVGCILLSLIPLGFAFRHLLRHRKTGGGGSNR